MSLDLNGFIGSRYLVSMHISFSHTRHCLLQFSTTCLCVIDDVICGGNKREIRYFSTEYFMRTCHWQRLSYSIYLVQHIRSLVKFYFFLMSSSMKNIAELVCTEINPRSVEELRIASIDLFQTNRMNSKLIKHHRRADVWIYLLGFHVSRDINDLLRLLDICESCAIISSTFIEPHSPFWVNHLRKQEFVDETGFTLNRSFQSSSAVYIPLHSTNMRHEKSRVFTSKCPKFSRWNVSLMFVECLQKSFKGLSTFHIF